MEAEAGPGDLPAADGSDVNVTVEDNDGDADGGMMQPHQFDKNIYTFSAAAGRALQQQQQASNIKNLV